MEEMSGGVSAGANRTSTIREELDKLLPSMGDVSGGLLQNAFINIFKSLRHWGPSDDIGLPRVMLPTLSPNLVEVLLFFAIRAQELKHIRATFR